MSSNALTKSGDTAVDHFLAEHARANKTLADKEIPWLKQLREQGLAQFAKQGFPTSRDEDWKYTNATPLTKRNFKYFPAHIDNSVAPSIPTQLLIEPAAQRLVFINGHFAPQLSALAALPHGVTITNLANALVQQPQLLEPYLGQLADQKTAGFTALNTAFIQDGVFIHLPPNVSLTQPIHLLFLTSQQQDLSFHTIRNLIIIEENSQATIIEDYANLESNSSFTNTVTELSIGKHATVAHYKLLREDEQQAYHVGTIQVQQHLHSHFTSLSFALGAALARSDINVVLAAEHAECNLNGLYLTTGKQHVDHHTLVDHTKPQGTSRENYKGVLADSSRAVFNGRVIVHPGANKTDAEQSNKNLLLSNNTEIDTKPQLEIYNDDVRCMHGATVGQLSEDSLFYLRARGIAAQDAKRMLIYAFIREILELVPLLPLRKQLEDHIHRRDSSFAKEI